MPAKKDKNIFHCSFCGKPQYKVRKIMASKNANICDECTMLNFAVLVAHGEVNPLSTAAVIALKIKMHPDAKDELKAAIQRALDSVNG